MKSWFVSFKDRAWGIRFDFQDFKVLKETFWAHQGFLSVSEKEALMDDLPLMKTSEDVLRQSDASVCTVPFTDDIFPHNHPGFLRRTTGLTYFYGRNGMTLAWLTANTPTTRWIWIRPCWTPSGNPTCSLPTKREPISTRSPQTTSCWGFSKMAASCIASGDHRLYMFEQHSWCCAWMWRATWGVWNEEQLTIISILIIPPERFYNVKSQVILGIYSLCIPKHGFVAE